MQYLETTQPQNGIPYDINNINLPPSPSSAIWLIFLSTLSILTVTFKSWADAKVRFLAEKREQELAEEKAELLQREALVKHLQSQNEFFCNVVLNKDKDKDKNESQINL